MHVSVNINMDVWGQMLSSIEQNFFLILFREADQDVAMDISGFKKHRIVERTVSGNCGIKEDKVEYNVYNLPQIKS